MWFLFHSKIDIFVTRYTKEEFDQSYLEQVWESLCIELLWLLSETLARLLSEPVVNDALVAMFIRPLLYL